MFLLFVFCVLIDTAARLAQPYLYKVVVDTLTEGITAGQFSAEQTSFLYWIVGLWFVFSVCHNLFNARKNFLSWRIGGLASEAVHMQGFRRLLRLDYQKHTREHSSKFAKIVDNADTSMWEMIQWWLNRFLPATISFIAILFIAFSVNWQMTLMALAVIPPYLIVTFSVLKKYEDEQHKVNKLWNIKHEHLSDQIANIITYKLNQNEPLFMDVQKKFSQKALESQHRLNKKWAKVDMFNPDVIARFLVMAYGVFLVKEGTITLGTLFMFMGLMNEILIPLHILGDILPVYSRRARYIDRFLKLQNEQDEILDPNHPKPLSHPQGKLEFRNVHYLYPQHEKEQNDENGFSIHDLSFVINPGEHMAIVGHSGAGKSTVMALMTRLIDPTQGQILLDGVNIRDFRQEDYHRVVGVVLQEHSLYDETIAQNIAYGKPNATREEIMEAAKKAAAHEFIMRLPKGYDTLIGERGVRLSGGEKQRISIARAILKNPILVILDEPTSALDSITEAKVQKGLMALMKGRTTVTIAHRLSTVREADKILVMEKGSMVDIGSHDQLMLQCEDYREMVRLQTSGFLADAMELRLKVK